MPALQSARASVEEALQKLEGLKRELGQVSYTQMLARLKEWRTLFYVIDFTTAKSLEELQKCETDYRGLRELLQWRMDELQKPAWLQVQDLKRKHMVGGLRDDDLTTALSGLEQTLKRTPYDFEDLAFYQQDLQTLVRREFVRIKEGEESVLLAPYRQGVQRLEELRAQNAGLRQQQLLVLGQQRELLAKGGVYGG